ncbi:hypothetical protein ACKFRL_07725 [Corynebacterium marquesiae]|uniref:hypothetical protein n=1 Tax=Corynebacterium marquesiae TaxID=2913503 RepID=UPI0038CF5B41
MNIISVYKSRLWKRWYVACGTHIFINTPDWKHAYEAADMLVRVYSKDQILDFARRDQQLEIISEKPFVKSLTKGPQTLTKYEWK